MTRAARATARAAATLAVAVTAAALLPGVAHAGGPGVWTNLSENPAGGAFPRMGNVDEPSVARFGPNLQVLWKARYGGNSDHLRTRIVAANGASATANLPVLENWAGFQDSPKLLNVGGQRLVVFGGLRSIDSTDPYTKGSAHTASSPDGLGWTLAPGSISALTTVYSASGLDAVVDGDTPVWVGNPATGNGVYWHRGTDGAIPASTPDSSALLGGCCAYDAATARDQVTGQVFASFFSNSNNQAEKGIHVGRILPTQGAFVRAPASSTLFNGRLETTSPDQRIAMVGRQGGGVWTAYEQGYPSTTNIRLYEANSGRTIAVPGTRNASHISLAAASGGRIWVMWVDRTTSTFRAVRSNPSVTAFGAQRVLRAPSGHTQLWKTAGDASNGPLDLVVTAERPGAQQINVFHQQVQAGLSLAFGRRVIVTRAGVRLYPVVVTDAGVPVRGATIRLGRTVVATTGRTGAAYVPIGRGVRGTFAVTAARAGYFPASAPLRVR